MHLAIAAAALVLGLPGSGATASYANGQLSLALRYEMTCGQPGPGPLRVELPQAFRLANVRVAGHASSVRGHTVSVAVPGPAGVNCMSITLGTLRVHIGGVTAPPGSYTVKAGIRRYVFAAHLRIP